MTAPSPPPPPTPSQTVGPFFHDALFRGAPGALATDPEVGAATIVLEGRVMDAHGEGIADAMVELWRPDPDRDDETGAGLGWARSATDETGVYRLTTSAPAALPHPGGGRQAPHVVLLVFARGLLDQLATRAYPVGGGDGAPEDPVLAAVPEARRATLLAPRDGEVDGHPRHRFDIRLQGAGETVFFRI